MSSEPRHDGPERETESGSALIMVLLLSAVLFVMAIALLFQTGTETLIAVNEQDHLKALGFAEAGLTWAQRRIEDGAGGGYTALLKGPDQGSSSDDYLLGLRDLSLTASSQFTSSNEGSASAIVQRDFFGDGSRAYELVRLQDRDGTRAHTYVRLDDNYDDDATDPTNDDPLNDTDDRVRITAVAEYPIFVGSGGVELAQGGPRRSSARRVVEATIGPATNTLPAISSNGDIDIGNSLEICGDCGSVQANQDLDVTGSPTVCEDGTASGSFLGSTSGIQGNSGGGYPTVELPVVSPYDDLFVPDHDIFDALSCGAPTASDPGNSKYFALVADGGEGVIYKAYWDFSDSRWTWRMIDDLNDAIDVKLDDCGRAPGDPNQGSLVCAAVGGGDDDDDDDDEDDDGGCENEGEFYGFENTSIVSSQSCNVCGGSGDASLCTLSNNDYTNDGYYDASTGAPRGQGVSSTVTLSPPLPGSFAPDSSEDFETTSWPENGMWRYNTDRAFSALYGAVIFVYANVEISGNPANPGSVDYCDSSGCSSSIPGDLWPVTLISYGNIEISGEMTVGPANGPAGYGFQFVAGRDIMITGNPNEYNTSCSSGCSSSVPGNIEDVAGVTVAHEQIQTNGTPSIFGMMIAEDAIDCSTTVGGPTQVNGGPNVFYDCNHPANPWASGADPVLTLWQELE